MGGKSLSVDGSYRSSKLREELIQYLSWYVTRDTTCLLTSFQAFTDNMVIKVGVVARIIVELGLNTKGGRRGIKG